MGEEEKKEEEGRDGGRERGRKRERERERERESVSNGSPRFLSFALSVASEDCFY